MIDASTAIMYYMIDVSNRLLHWSTTTNHLLVEMMNDNTTQINTNHSVACSHTIVSWALPWLGETKSLRFSVMQSTRVEGNRTSRLFHKSVWCRSDKWCIINAVIINAVNDPSSHTRQLHNTTEQNCVLVPTPPRHQYSQHSHKVQPQLWAGHSIAVP